MGGIEDKVGEENLLPALIYQKATHLVLDLVLVDL